MAIDAGPDAYAIFSRARAAVTSARYPRCVDYTIAVSGLEGTTPRANHYRATSHPGDGTVLLAPISAEELAAPPPVPHGFNFSLTATLAGGNGVTGVGVAGVRVGRSAASPDLIGVPMLAPTYMFGLFDARSAARAAEPSDSKLPLIAVVATQKHDYAVTLVDRPSIDGVPTYHLRLVPLHDPKNNRLRDLWVSTGNYLPVEAVVSGNFTLAPLVDVPWTIRFTTIGGAPFIARETANATLYLPHRRVVRDAAVAFQNVRPAGSSIVGRPLVQPEATETTLTEPRV